jgi:hypothetical protein
VPQVRARFLGANLGAAYVIGILANFVVKLQVRFSFRKLQSGFNPGSWIEKIAQRVSNKIKSQHRQHHRHRGKKH